MPAHPVIDRRRLLHKRRPWFAPNEAYHLYTSADSEIGGDPSIADLCDWLSQDTAPNAGILKRIPDRYVDRKLSMSGVTGELLLVAAEVLENVTSSSIPHLLGNTLAWEDVVTEVNLAFIQEILEAAVGASRVSSPALVPPVHAAATKAPQDPKATDPFRNGFSRRTRRPDRVVEHAAAVMALQQGHDLSTQVRIVDALAVEIGGASLALQPSGVLE